MSKTFIDKEIEKFDKTFPPLSSDYQESFSTKFEMEKDNRKQIKNFIKSSYIRFLKEQIKRLEGEKKKIYEENQIRQ